MSNKESHKILVDVTGVAFSGSFMKSLRKKLPYYQSEVHGRAMSKEQVARKIGVHQHQISRWERYPFAPDCRRPRVDKLKKISLFYQADPILFLGLLWLSDDLADDFVRNNIDLDVLGSFCDRCGRFIGNEEFLLDQWKKDDDEE